MTSYFTERESGPVPRSAEIVDARVWGGIFSLVQVRVANGSFGFRFPEYCSDVGNENAACGCDWRAFGLVLAAEVPGVTWPLSPNEVPETPVIMDLLEFCARAVGEPVSVYYHSYMRHNHLRWEREVGLAQFVTEVNTLFGRNGLAFELDAEGQARRLLPQPVRCGKAAQVAEMSPALQGHLGLTGPKRHLDRRRFALRVEAARKRPTEIENGVSGAV